MVGLPLSLTIYSSACNGRHGGGVVCREKDVEVEDGVRIPVTNVSDGVNVGSGSGVGSPVGTGLGTGSGSGSSPLASSLKLELDAL